MRKKIKNACSILVVSMTVVSMMMSTILNRVVIADEIETYQEIITDEKNTEFNTTENQQESENREEGNISEETKAGEIETPSQVESGIMPKIHELTEEELRERNHKNDEFGIKVISGNLPWYVKLVVEEVDTEPFWDAYNSGRYTYSDDYWGEEYDGDNIEYDDDDEDDEVGDEETDDEYVEDEDENIDDEDNEYEDDSDNLDEGNEDLSNEEEIEDEDKSFILKACKISFVDTRNNEEYIFSEEEKIDLSMHIEYTNDDRYFYSPEVLKMQEDATVKFLFSQNTDEDNSFKELDYEDYDEAKEENEQVEDEELNDNLENEYNEDNEYEYDDENEPRIYQVEKDIKFSVTEEGDYAVLMQQLMYKTCTSNESIEENVHYEQPKKRSPKTGINIKWLIVSETASMILLGFSAMNFVGRRKEDN